MGIFDGYLIVTDWDGTLFSGGQITQKNLDAIKYFQENGGLFTVCSGRPCYYLKEYEHLVCPNTYTVGLNGAYIADNRTGDVLYTGVADHRIFDIIRSVLKLDIYKTLSLHCEGDDQYILLDAKSCYEEIEKYENKRVYKAVFVADSEINAELGKGLVPLYLDSDYSAFRSWNVSIEIMPTKNNKGAAIKRLKEATGAKKVIAVGDYENDISMILNADIGYAVENACPDLKMLASKTTSSCNDGSIADIIYSLKPLD